MPDRIRCVSPIDSQLYVERPLTPATQTGALVDRARRAQHDWAATPVAERCRLVSAAIDAFVADGAEIAEEITRQMGRPLTQSPGEIRGFEERARHMLAIAPECLADIQTRPQPGFMRFIRRDPLGVVFVMAPWNYPYLTAVNSIVPALLAGNAVLLKHSAQTPLCAERLEAAFRAGGLPEHVFQFMHLSHEAALGLVRHPQVDFVALTGSVDAGRSVQSAVSSRFIGVGLELGGKDPAYVRPDAQLDFAIENLVDGVFFNAGQSCCGIERIYVHTEVYEKFVAGFVEKARGYTLGDPLDPQTDLGPMVRASAADFVRAQIDEAVSAGAVATIDPYDFRADRENSPYMAPQVLTSVDHSMRVMTEESFGPVVGIMQVASDAEAVELMNDSAFGLTASIWTEDLDAALEIGGKVETGTWFMNRCDYLDPELAWTGVKDSGHGCTLSSVGFEQLTRPKSFHLRTET